MPSGTTIQQFVNDLKDRKSTIARAFDKVYKHCKGDNADRNALVAELRAWTGTPHTLPNLLGYGLTADLKGAEKDHLGDWPDRLNVRNAMVRALEDDNRDIEFFWDLDDDDLTENAPSKSVIDPPEAGNDLTDSSGAADPGGTGPITVIFLTPRKKVKKSFPTIAGITIGGINVEV